MSEFGSSLRGSLGKALIRAARFYTARTPVDKGKYRLMTAAMAFATEMPEPSIVRTKDGCLVRADLTTGMHTFVYFLGDYEPAISDICRELVMPGNVCIDVGANFGWYALLFHKLVGSTGSVYAFEPVPPTFEELNANWKLAGTPTNLMINREALSDFTGELTINTFPDMPSGHASASPRGRTDTTVYTCPTVTLDIYLR
ncbi:MAG: FkbM family methyltransferase, partial [Pyrinomonadaceae bacterium]